MDWTDRLAELSKNSRVARALWLATALLISWLHLFVHTVGINHSDLSLDDAGTWGVARRSLGTVLTLPTEFHSQPPLYYLVLHFLLPIGSSPWFLRGISWFFCWLLILFVLFYWHELNLFARVGFCLLFVFSALTPYLASAVRPYGLAAFLTLVSSVTFLRLARDPTRRRAIIYAVWVTAMLYTMAFEVAVFLVHGLVVLGMVVADFVRRGRAEAWRRCTVWVLTMVAVGIAYLPYLVMAIHFQYQPNPANTLDLILRASVYANTLQVQFGFSQGVSFGLLGLAGVALVGELRRRNGLVFLWLLTIAGSIAFVWYFIIGRSAIGAQVKYMTPAFVAACALVSLGVQEFRPLANRRVWPVLVAMLVLLAGTKFEAFHAYVKAGPDIGQFTTLHRALMEYPGKKVVFFDVGYDGQHMEYVTRDDPDTTYATMRGRLWASGGDNHLTEEYVTSTIERSRRKNRCFFYYIQNRDGPPFARAFVPTLERNGYRKTPAFPLIWGHEVVGYCRT